MKNPKVMNSLDDTILSLYNEIELSPLLLSWAVVRYIVSFSIVVVVLNTLFKFITVVKNCQDL